MNDRLFRSRTDRVLSGVAGGLAELWNLDPALVRVIWALLVPLTGGLALLAYIVLAIVVPEGPVAMPGGSPPATGDAAASAESPGGTGEGTAPTASAVSAAPPRARGGSPGMVLGAILILIGAYLLVREYIPDFDPDRFWPLILVALGVVLLVAAAGGSRRSGS